MRKELLLIPISLLVAVIAAEMVLRLVPGLLPLDLQLLLEDSPETRGVSHPHIGNLHSPSGTHVVRTSEFEIPYPTDARGFNNVEPWPETADIVVVGDSLTFGYGVAPDQAWPRLVAERLEDVEVVNLGLIGAGPQQYARLYETFGVDLSPKLLLIGMFVGNDFWDAEMFDLWQKSGVGGNYMIWRDFGRGAPPSLSDPIRAARDLLRKHSYLYNWVRFARQAFTNAQRGEPMALPLADGTMLQLRPSHLTDKTQNVEAGNPIFELSIDELARMHALATERGTEVLVVLQPGKEETYLPALDGSDPDPAAPVRAALEARGIPYLDLLPAYRERAEVGAALFFEVDGHPNLEGYRLTAEKVVAYLERNAETYELSLRR